MVRMISSDRNAGIAMTWYEGKLLTLLLFVVFRIKNGCKTHLNGVESGLVVGESWQRVCQL